jgi:hypothetical protein
MENKLRRLNPSDVRMQDCLEEPVKSILYIY